MDMAIKRAALGRIARQGDLYNACTDTFCNGLSIFEDEVPDSFLENVLDPVCSSNVVVTKTRLERCKSLGLENELMLSVIGLNVPVCGSAEFLTADAGGMDGFTVALIYQNKTSAECLKFCSEECSRLTLFSSAKGSGATHVVVNVEWGLNAVIALRFSSEDEAEKGRIFLQKFADEINASGQIEMTGNNLPPAGELDLKFYADLQIKKRERPATLEGCLVFLNEIPLNLNESGGRMRPVSYFFLPLDMLRSMRSGIANVRSPVRSHDDWTIEITVRFLENLARYRRRVYGLVEAVRSRPSAFRPSTCDDIWSNWIFYKNTSYSLRSRIMDNIKAFRSGKAVFVAELVQSGEAFLRETDLCLSEFDFVNDKLNYIAKIEAKKGIVGADSQLLEEEQLDGEYYVFFANLANMNKQFLDCSLLFEELCTKSSGKCILCDTDINKLEGIVENSISKYIGGCCVEDDVLRLFNLSQEYNLVKLSRMPKRDAKKPFQRTRVKVSCPKSLCSNGCDGQKRDWVCYFCEKTIEYGFNDCFYCDCGESDAFSTLWCCQDILHGKDYEKFSKEMLQDQLSELKHCEEYNVLLIGETGSGKSTWINSIANYVLYANLDAALQQPLNYLIPSSFSIQIGETNVKKIQIGQSDDEVFGDGQSATQKPKSYSFMHNDVLIRLIDVPGVCDTRGPEQDKKNFDLILQELRTISELHAICILLTPDSSRLTLAFQYCINELLTHLHKSAAKNIIFCFTKTRQTFYRAGQTLPVLNEYLRDFKRRRNVEIVLDKNTMFYFDNEAFKLLCAAKNNITFKDEEKKAYEESWNFSAAETQRFLQNVLKLPPHKTREMISLNEARRIIVTLTKPLADITDNINTNLRLANEAKEECQHLDNVASDLESRLHIKQVTLEAVPINYPRTVCGSANCIETKRLPGTNVTTVHYKQTCHDHCYLRGIEPEKYPNPGLQGCWAMERSRSPIQCHQCGCTWDFHLHVRYLQEQREISVIDETTELLLQEKKNCRIEKKDVLAAYDRQIDVLKKRHERIKGICTKFGAFLDRNSIVPYNDALIQYLKYAIKLAEQEAGITRNTQKVESLRRYLDEYTKELEILKANLNAGKETIEVEDIMDLKQELYSMKWDSCNIARYLQVLNDANNRHFKREERYFDADEHVVNRRKCKYPRRQWSSSVYEFCERLPLFGKYFGSRRNDGGF